MLSRKEQNLEGKLKISFCGLMPITHTNTNTLVNCSLIQQIQLKV